ncbi:MAG: pilus assembly protein [Lachnospiraceae bacterium]|nr:pilus assembly protein [Lachnospiraceae bacterium]
MLKDKFKGYYTVEAAMLMPILLTCILLVMYLSFYVHDKCVLDSVCYQAALRGGMVTDPEVDPTGKAEAAARELLEKRLIIARNTVIKVDKTMFEIRVKGSADFVIPKGIVLIPELRKSGIKITADKKYLRIQPIEAVRALRAGKSVKQILDNRKGREE